MNNITFISEDFKQMNELETGEIEQNFVPSAEHVIFSCELMRSNLQESILNIKHTKIEKN